MTLRETDRVEHESAALRKELGLTDLVLTQILYVVGLSWVGAAAKLGNAQIAFWLAAMALFYLPQAAVVIHLSRRFPLEGGLYQWAKLGLSGGVAFVVAWNLWIYAIVLLGAFGIQVASRSEMRYQALASQFHFLRCRSRPSTFSATGMPSIRGNQVNTALAALQ